jgi:hypothetical protein
MCDNRGVRALLQPGRDFSLAGLEVVMSIKRRFEHVSFPMAFTAQVPPLAEADLAVVQRAMAEIAPDWAVQLDGICADEATLVLVPDDGDDAAGPSFVISRETYGLRVDQVHWDAVTEVGVFASLNDVLEVLRIRLTFCSDSAVPASVTLH